jgi:hypothetical protein
MQAWHKGIDTLNFSLKEVFMVIDTERLGAIFSTLVFCRGGGKEKGEVG